MTAWGIRSGAAAGAPPGTGGVVRAALALAGLLCGASVARAGDEDADLAAWIDGPIRYLARAEEVKTFRKLDGDPERALFIERFWARRDPSPETLTNEARQLFWERVREANELFLDSGKPGWKTDRGKIHVLYGPPTHIEEDLHLKTGVTSGQGVIRWIYEGRPAQRRDLDPVVVVAFVRDPGGEFRLSYDPQLTSVFFDPQRLADPHDRMIDRFLSTFGPPRRSELSVMLDLGRMQEVPPHAAVLLERIETVEAYQTRPLDVVLQRYRHPEDGRTVAVLTVDVTHVAEGSAPSVVARFSFPDEPGRPPRMLGEDSFKLATTGGRRLAQGRIKLDPARYALTLVVVDPETAATGLHRETLELAPATPEMQLSDLALTQELEALPYAALASHDEPFHVGPFRVYPRPNATFRAGETVTLFYEIYGGRAPYRIAYQLEGRELDGSWIALGQPARLEDRGSAQGWDLPTSAAWPRGDYRLRVAVADGDQHAVEAVVPFVMEQASEAGGASD